MSFLTQKILEDFCNISFNFIEFYIVSTTLQF